MWGETVNYKTWRSEEKAKQMPEKEIKIVWTESSRASTSLQSLSPTLPRAGPFEKVTQWLNQSETDTQQATGRKQRKYDALATTLVQPCQTPWLLRTLHVGLVSGLPTTVLRKQAVGLAELVDHQTLKATVTKTEMRKILLWITHVGLKKLQKYQQLGYHPARKGQYFHRH